MILNPGSRPRPRPGRSCGAAIAVLFVALLAASAVGVVQLWELSAPKEVSKSVPSPSPQAPPGERHTD